MVLNSMVGEGGRDGCDLLLLRGGGGFYWLS